MTVTSVLTIKRVVLGTLCAGALVLSTGATSVSAAPEKTRKLHVTKTCIDYHGAAGEWCTVTASNLRQLPVDSKVLYSQAAGVPAGLLDSNVVLDAGDGNRAVGRCTLDFATNLGLCTFSDGTGEFAGFQARVNVSYAGGYDYDWDGFYSFDRDKH